ncbi:MAG: hypothetical protein ABSE08_09135 [Syntrophobacteraceae bacterium]|jgi:hypothetical protein
MYKKLLSLSIFTIAFAVSFVFWAPNGTMAACSSYHEGYIDSANSFADDYDWAANRAGPARDMDRDMDRGEDRAMQPPLFQSYGLQGDWRGQY